MRGFADARIRQSGYAEKVSEMTQYLERNASIDIHPSIQVDVQRYTSSTD